MSDIKDILAETTFRRVPGVFIYAKLEKAPPDVEQHFLVSKDEDEVTVVTKLENYEGLGAKERNKDDYSLFELRVAVPFYAVGFLASVTSAIASKGANILVISTYSKDYILVRTEHTQLAAEVLNGLGMKPGK